jgi:c-di-GMP-related signal transduction protein
MNPVVKAMSLSNLNPLEAMPEALLRLELLLGERAVDLTAVSDVVTRDPGLRIHVLRLAHDTGEMTEVLPSIHECIVEIGIEGLRESLRHARMLRQSN